ncbi:unnamed protein product [Linum tenue]|uniref:Uncharacterized protein n=1 Tax=Linum tenue TaxID=586396 RepID=A0AAV0L4R2_9ROSI|nr:unnamed protein product [Linum tenue]
MTSWVAPPPRFSHPAATPLAVPTTGDENMELIQNWVETKVARENPVKNLTRMNETVEETMGVKNTAGTVIRTREAEASRGPTRSQAVPITMRAKAAPVTEAMPPYPISTQFWMIGSKGGAAKVETKQAKKETQER